MQPKKADGQDILPVSAQAVLFDLDGTLLDSVPIIMNSFRETFRQMDIPFDEGFVRAQIGIPLEAQGELFGGERAEEFIERYRNVYRTSGADAQLFPGAAQTLHALKDRGFRLALVTSKSRRATNRVTEATGIAGCFDAIVTVDDVSRHKPDPEPIQKALQALGINASEAVYVGDATFDVMASAKAGAPMIGVSWGAGTKEALAPGCVRVVDEWPELLASVSFEKRNSK